MHRFFRPGHNKTARVFAASWLMVAAIALAEPGRRGPQAVLLDSKSASKLLVSASKPAYPTLAKLNYIQGRVRLEVHVNRQGQVRDVHVLEGHPFLAAPAMETVRDWTYRPLVKESVTIPFVTSVEIRFSLRFQKLKPFPERPEEDLRRAVRPPRALDLPSVHNWPEAVRMRVLVSEEGRVMDSKPIDGRAACFEVARGIVERWVFEPARWGSISVPWYVDVDVPIEALSTEDTATTQPCG